MTPNSDLEGATELGSAKGLRVVGFDARRASAVRRDSLRAKRWVETVSRGGDWRGLPPRTRPMVRPVVEDGEGRRFVVDTGRDGRTRLRSYDPPAAASAGGGGFRAIAGGAASGRAPSPPPGMTRMARALAMRSTGAVTQGPAASDAGDGRRDGPGPLGDPLRLASGLATQGFSALLASQASAAGLSGIMPKGPALGGLGAVGANQLLGMGLSQIGGLAMSAWSVDDESSTGEHLAQMASQELMGSLQGEAQSFLMEQVFGPAGPPAPGADASVMEKTRDYVMGKPRGAGIAIAHNSNPTDHGGVLTATAATTMAGGLTVGRLGDAQACPMFTGSTPHVGGPVNTSNPTVIAEGVPVTGEDHTALCTGVGGQTLLKPTVQTVRIGPAGMPVAVSSNGEDKNASESAAESESGSEQTDPQSSEQSETESAEQSESQSAEDQTSQESTASEESGSEGDPESQSGEASSEQPEPAAEQPQATGGDPETKVTEKTTVGMSEKGPYIEKSTQYEDEGSMFNTSTTNKVRGTLNPITGKGSLGGSTEGCASYAGNPGDALCITGGGSVGSDGVDLGAGVVIKGGSVSGSVQVTPPPVKPTDFFGFDVEPSGAGSMKVRLPNPRNPATGLEVSLGWDENICDGTLPWCDNFMGWPWEQ